MAETILRDQRLFIGGVNLSCQASSVAINMEAAELDRTALCDTARRRRGGLRDDSIGATGFFDAGAADEALFSQIGLAGQLIGVTAPDAAAGATAFALQAMVGEYQPLGGSVGDLAEFSLSAMGDGAVHRGKVAALADLTGSGAGTAVELPSVEAGRRLSAFVFVHALAAGAELDVLIRSSAQADMSSPSTRITLDTITEAGAALGVFSGTTSHTFFRPSFTLTGASASVAVILAVQ